MTKYAPPQKYTRYGLPVVSTEAANIAYENLSRMLKYSAKKGEAYLTKAIRAKLRRVKEENPELYSLYRTLRESSDLISVNISSVATGNLSERIKRLEKMVAQQKMDRREYIDLAFILSYDALSDQARLSFKKPKKV